MHSERIIAYVFIKSKLCICSSDQYVIIKLTIHVVADLSAFYSFDEIVSSIKDPSEMLHTMVI